MMGGRSGSKRIGSFASNGRRLTEWGAWADGLGSAARPLSQVLDVPYGIGITAIHDHLGYMMLVATQGSTSHASDRSAFDAARKSFRFAGN
jgi:hypothetical protein